MQAVTILQQFMSDTLSYTTKQIEEDYKNLLVSAKTF